jgi:hypothetical protein
VQVPVCLLQLNVSVEHDPKVPFSYTRLKIFALTPAAVTLPGCVQELLEMVVEHCGFQEAEAGQADKG